MIFNFQRRFKPFIIYLISWKALLFLGLIALSLQTFSIGLSWWIQLFPKKNSDVKDNESLSHYHLAQKLTNSATEILGYISEVSVLDSSGEFKVAVDVFRDLSNKNSVAYSGENQIKDEEANDEDIVTLVSQCSLSHLHLLPELAIRWEGPVSISLFLLNEELQAGVKLLLLLRKCYPEIQSSISFSIVYPLSSPTSLLEPTLQNIPCSQLAPTLVTYVRRSNYEFAGIQYPNNLLRNVARRAVRSKYMMLLDIDMLPSKKLHSKFVAYLKENRLNFKKGEQFNMKDEKTVWVVPSYEIEANVQIPEDKIDLLRLKEIGKARPFYQELCWKCQKYTEYDAWEKHKNSNKKGIIKLTHLYEVLWKDPWEPFYISKSNVPLYNERFRQYGFNRISQVCELHVAGYRFLVLDSAFVIHKGYKKPDKLHKGKNEELERNRIIFREFKTNLKEKYPESSRRCY